MITGYGDEAVATKAIKAGADNYISKGKISKEELSKLIDDSIEAAHKEKIAYEKNQDLVMFANVIAHDMSAPIRTILYLAEKLNEKKEIYKDKYYEDRANHIHKSAQTLAQMIKSLHSSCTLDNNEAHFQKINLNDLLSQTLSSLECLTSQHKMHVDIEKDIPFINGDKDSLTQVFLNLFNNSIKFCKPTRPIKIKIACEKNGDYLNLLYQDNGIGFGEEDHTDIFQLFKKGQHPQKREGMGLGLSLCKKIMQNHDGDITIQSSSKNGTIFLLTFPLHGKKSKSDRIKS
jgi:signal transduction histidine kinase